MEVLKRGVAGRKEVHGPTIPEILAIPKITTVDITRPFASFNSEEKRALRIECSRPGAVNIFSMSNSHALVLGNKERKVPGYDERERSYGAI